LRSVTPYCRILLTSAALVVLLSPNSVRAQSADLLSPWALCEPDDLARDIVPATTHASPPDQLPIQAEAARLDSAPDQSVLEGDARLSRGDQRLRADRITLDRQTNRAKADNGFVYGDPRQALRGKQAEVDLNAETGWFKDVDYYLARRNAQGSAEQARVDQEQRRNSGHCALTKST
jgi:LPS-assembly protein